MFTRSLASLTIVMVSAIGSLALGAEPTLSQRLTWSDSLQVQPRLSTSQLMDATYDFEVWSAPDVTGQTEFVVWGRFADSGDWDLVHEFAWHGTPDHGMYQADLGVWTFSSWWSARQAAEKLMGDGEITDYEIEERPVEPQWSYEATFGTRSAAEDYAEMFEEIAADVGSPHLTKIVSVSTLQFSSTLRK